MPRPEHRPGVHGAVAFITALHACSGGSSPGPVDAIGADGESSDAARMSDAAPPPDIAQIDVRATDTTDVFREAAPPPPPSDGGGQWENVTPPQVDDTCVNLQNYGMQSLDGAKPDAPLTLYVGTCNQGLFKTTDGGDTWVKIDTGNYFNHDGTPYTRVANNLDTGRNWALAVDPTDSNVVYTTPGYGFDQQLWKSTNGGVDWTAAFGDPSVTANESGSVYSISINPADHLHIIVGSAGWAGMQNVAGVMESRDGGQTWIAHQPNDMPGGTPSTWGIKQYMFFLGQNDDGTPDTAGNNWLAANQASGLWRTTDASNTWTQVATWNYAHGMASMYRSTSTGALYIGGVGEVWRSADNGQTWAGTGAQSTGDGYGGIVGDGTHIWAMLANTGGSTNGPYQWQVLPEDDTTSAPGASNWTFYNAQMFNDGPMTMAYDATNHRVYASQWCTGVWRRRE